MAEAKNILQNDITVADEPRLRAIIGEVLIDNSPNNRNEINRALLIVYQYPI